MNTTLECIKFGLFMLTWGACIVMLIGWLVIKYGGQLVEIKDVFK